MRLKKRMTRVTQFINAPREKVYRALISPNAIKVWKVRTGMTCQLHSFDALVGGRFRVSVTYDLPAGVGKTTTHTDTYQGRFVELVPNERVVEIDEFETSNAELRGEMKGTIELADKTRWHPSSRSARRDTSRGIGRGQRGGLANCSGKTGFARHNVIVF